MRRKMISCVICTLMIAIIFVVEIPKDVSAQPPIEWEKTFGGIDEDQSRSVQQTLDGGFIIAGWTESYGAGNDDVWLIKTDSSGNKQWEKFFGGVEGDVCMSVQQTSDHGYIVVGSTDSYGAGYHDIWLIKTDSLGNKQWDKTYGGIYQEWGWSVQQTLDGGYIITGSTESYGSGDDDIWLIKTDSSGNKLWDQTFGGTREDMGFSVQQTNDGGFITVGYTESILFGIQKREVLLIKTDSLGNKQWDKTFGGSEMDHGYSVQQTNDNGYVIIGFTFSYGAGAVDVWLIKTDSSGNEQWNKTYGGSSNDGGLSVQQTYDGGFIITGSTESYGVGDDDLWLIKTDSLGNQLWDLTFGGDSYDIGYSVQQTSDLGYIIAGETFSQGVGNNDAWVIRLEGYEPSIQPPGADAGVDQIIDEFNTVIFDGSASYDPDGVIENYEWDFNAADGLGWETSAGLDATGPTPTHIYGDDGVYTVTLRVTDNDNLSATDTCNVTVQNVDPTVTIESITIEVEIGLRVAGRKFNDVGMTLYEAGISIGYVSIERLPGSPNEQMAWIPMTFDMTKTYSATVIYTPEDPPNIGANPVWIYIKFPNGSIQKIHHTFNVQQSKNRDSDHWNHVDPWEVDLNGHLVGWEFEVDYHVTDPGSDDETLTFTYGSQVKTVTYLNNPPNPDPYPSPEINPVYIMDTTTLIYEGPGVVTLVVKDDDNIWLGVGEGTDSFSVG